MTPEALKLHASLRLATSEKIRATPAEFKVCSQCQSIAFKRAAFCPLCHAYRWLEDPEDVKRVTLIMGGNAFPATAGTVPRLTPA